MTTHIAFVLGLVLGSTVFSLLMWWRWKSTCDALVESISAHRQQSALDDLKVERVVRLNRELTERLNAAPVTASKDSKWIALYQEKYVENAELKRQLKEARGAGCAMSRTMTEAG